MTQMVQAVTIRAHCWPILASMLRAHCVSEKETLSNSITSRRRGSTIAHAPLARPDWKGGGGGEGP
jgi:hypothetical protein